VWVVTHTLTGLALGALLHERGAGLWAIVPAALGLHLVLDIVPHWDYTRTRKRAVWAGADVAAAAAALVLARAAGIEWAVVLAGLVSAAPDLDVLNAVWTTERRVRFFPSHWARFPHGSATPVPGTLVQAAIAAASVGLLVAVRG